MQPRMYYICVICTITKPPLIVMTAEHREILDAIALESRHALLHNTLLMTCLECNRLLEGVAKFQKTANVGIKQLLGLVRTLETKIDKHNVAEPKESTPMKMQTVNSFKPKFYWDKKNRKFNPHCTIVKRSELPRDLVVQVCADSRLVPRVTVKPKEILKDNTKPQTQIKECTKPAQITEELIIKDEPVFVIDSESDTECTQPVDETVSGNDVVSEEEDFAIKPHVQCKTEPDTCDYEVDPVIEPKSDVEGILHCESSLNNKSDMKDIPECENLDIKPDPGANDYESTDIRESDYGNACESSLNNKSDMKDIPKCENLDIKPDPELNDSESTDTCESDYGNCEDFILAALVKTNVPTLPYLKGLDTDVETNTSVANTTSRKRKRSDGRNTGTRTQSSNNRVAMRCVLCNKIFANKYYLREHIQRVHF